MRPPTCFMHGVEIMTDCDPCQKNQACNDPGIFGRKGQRIMVGEHQENNRQGEVVVMGGAHFCNLAIFGIRHAPRL